MHEKFRKNGLGLLMLRQIEYLLVMSTNPPKVLELHVGTYNTGAMRMYNKANYRQMKFLPRHYSWGGKRHDAYLYQKMIQKGIKVNLSQINNELVSWKNNVIEETLVPTSEEENSCNCRII